jgi:Fe-S-cluster containining protein
MIKEIFELSDYDEGNGVCRYLVNNRCSIYDRRPLICNVEAMYMKFFKAAMTEEQFIIANLNACQRIAERFQDYATLQKIREILDRIV